MFAKMWPGLSLAVLAVSLAFAEEPQSLYESRKWAELSDALAHTTGNNLYRGALAVAFNQAPHRTENLLLSVIHSAPTSQAAYQPYEWLSHLYLRPGPSPRRLSIMHKRR